MRLELDPWFGGPVLRCDFCGKELTLDNKPDKKPAYLKLTLWPQYNPWTLSWWKQHYFGDQAVARFCDEEHFKAFASSGKLAQMKA